MALSANTRETFASRRTLSSRLRAISGSMVLRSSCPHCAPTVTATWLPMTCAPTWITDSQMTGFTLPGMMLEPGCTAGSATSARPQRGPEFISRTSLAIFIRLAATVLSAPLAHAARVLRALRLEVVRRLAELRAGQPATAPPPRAGRTPGAC